MMPNDYYLVHANIATMRAPLDDPVMADFVALIDVIDDLAHKARGFIAQPKLPDEGEVFSIITLVNVSIWESIESLKQFTYQGIHASALKQRREWFKDRAAPTYVLYWKPAGEMTSEAEISARLDHLKVNGETPHAFTFKKCYTVQDMLNRECLEFPL